MPVISGRDPGWHRRVYLWTGHQIKVHSKETQQMQCVDTGNQFLKKPFTPKSSSRWGSLELGFHPGTRTMYLLYMVTHIGALFADHLPMGVQELVTSKSITSYLLPSLSRIKKAQV